MTYRPLTPRERAVLHSIQELEHTCASVCTNVRSMPGSDTRAVEVARMQLEGAVMWLRRALAHPNTEPHEEN